MKIELEKKDKQEIAEEVTQMVINALKPLFNGRCGDDVIFNVDGLAEYLKVKKQWVYDRVHSKAIPHYKVGKYPRFRKTKIDEWLDKREKGISKKPSNSVRRLLEPASQTLDNTYLNK